MIFQFNCFLTFYIISENLHQMSRKFWPDNKCLCFLNSDSGKGGWRERGGFWEWYLWEPHQEDPVWHQTDQGENLNPSLDKTCGGTVLVILTLCVFCSRCSKGLTRTSRPFSPLLCRLSVALPWMPPARRSIWSQVSLSFCFCLSPTREMHLLCQAVDVQSFANLKEHFNE